MAAHTYWRMWMPYAYARSAGWLRAWEMEWRSAPGGADISETRIAGDCPGGVLSALFDNDPGGVSLWESLLYAGGGDNWIRLQFAAPVDVREIMWNSYAAGDTPTQFDMQSSDDGTNWTTEWSGTAAAGWVGEKTFTAPAPPVITFGGIEGTNVEIIDANTIDVDAPAHAAGAVDVVLTKVGSGAGPTAGRTTLGNISDWGAPIYSWVFKHTPASAFKVVRGFFNKTTAEIATNTRVLIYADDGSGTQPGAFIAMSDPFSGSAVAGWNEVSFPDGPTLQAGVQYWIGLRMEGPADGHFDLSVQSGMTGADKYGQVMLGTNWPAGSGGFNEQAAVYVEGAATSTATAPGGYTYDATVTAPDITDVQPDPAKASGGETMSVIGVRMEEGCVVRLAGREFSKYRNEIINGVMAAPGAPWQANAGEAPLVTWENGVANLFVRRHPDPGSVVLRYVGGQLKQTVNVPVQGTARIDFTLGGAVSAATPVEVWFGGQLVGTFTAAGVHDIRVYATVGPRTLMFMATGEVADAQVTVDNVSVKVASSSEIVVNGALNGSTGWGGGTSSPGGTIVSWGTVGTARLYARSWLDPDTHIKEWFYGVIVQNLVVPEACNGTLTFTLDGMVAGESMEVRVGPDGNPLHLASYTGNGQRSVQITFTAGGTYPLSFEFYSAKSGDYGIITDVSLVISPTSNDILVNGALADGTGWIGTIPAPATNGVTFSGGVANLFVRSYPDPYSVQYIYERGAVSQDFATEAPGASRVRLSVAGATLERPVLVTLDGGLLASLQVAGNHVVEIPNLPAGAHTLTLSVGGIEFDTSASVDNVALEAPPPWMIEWVGPTLLRFTSPPMPLGPQVLRVTNPNGEFDEYTINVESGIVWQTGRRRTVGHVNFH